MDNQFTDLDEPDVNDKYYCAECIKSKGFTHLMKLVLMVNEYPEAVNLIKKILRKKPKQVNKVNQKGWSALMLASLHSNSLSSLKIVKMLIEAGADLNLQMKDDDNNIGDTALIAVCRNEKIDPKIVKILIDNRANVNIQTYYGDNALIMACIYSTDDSNLKPIKMLTKAGANPCCYSSYSKTPLMLVIDKIDETGRPDSGFTDARNNTETVKLLIKSGVDVCANDKDYNTALSIALFWNERKVSDLLIKSFNINHRNNIGQTVLMILYDNDCMCTDTITRLIDAGADINAKDHDGKTILMYACESDYNQQNFYASDLTSRIDVLKKLIQLSDVEIKDNKGEFALMYLIKTPDFENKYKILKKLIHLSQSVINDKTKKGITTYDYYMKNKYRSDLDDQTLKILKGKSKTSKQKSARKV